MNDVTLCGNLGKDVEFKLLDGGASVATFSVATNEYYKDKKGEIQTQTEWHDIIAWGYLAEKCKNWRKGKTVLLKGMNVTRTWEKDGETRYRKEVRAKYIRIMNPDSRNLPTELPPDIAARMENKDPAPATEPATATATEKDLPF